MIATEDYTTWINAIGEIDGEQFVEYENTDGKKWRVFGQCNACGACEMPDTTQINIRVNPETGERETFVRVLNWVDEVGNPGACLEENYEQRKDIPMTPQIINGIDICSLRGEWL
jgi:hypothetical protein